MAQETLDVDPSANQAASSSPTDQNAEADAVTTSSHLEERVQVLNHAETFAVFNVFGDIPASKAGAFGLFYRGCRYLNGFEMFINGQKPVLLNSLIKDRNEMLNVNVTNDEVRDRGHVMIAKGVIFANRSKFLFHGACYEKITIQNFDLSPHNLSILIKYTADFLDIFEVRGVKRSRRGGPVAFQRLSAESCSFSYMGLDAIKRTARIHFSQAPTFMHESGAQVDINLAAGSDHTLYIEVVPEDDSVHEACFAFDEAKMRLIDQLKRNRLLFADMRSDNEQFNQWIDRSTVDLATLLSVTKEGLYPFAGVPWYNTIFGRDGLISSFFTLWTAPEIAKGVLLFLADHQAQDFDRFKDAEPGKILHEMRSGEMANLGEIPFKEYYGTIDATPLFIWLAGDYYMRTGDRKTLETIWPHIQAALQWIDLYGDGDGDGYVEYERKGEKGLHNQGWKDSHDSISHADGSLAEPPIALCEVQGYVYAAKLSASTLAATMGKKDEATRLREAAEKLKKQFNDDFWDDDLGSFCLALDGKKRPCRVLSSNPGHCLYSGIVDADKAASVGKSLVNSQLFSGWGIRTLARECRRYNPLSYHNGSVWPHDNAIAAMGLSRYGLKNEALLILDAFFDTANRIDGARLPELVCGLRRQAGESPVRYPVACSPQAWSVAALFGLLQATLGIEIDATTKTLVMRSPVLPHDVQKLTIDKLRLDDETLSLNLQSYEADVGVNVPKKPEGWRVVINK